MAIRIRSRLSRRTILAAMLVAVAPPARAQAPLTVFAAASLKPPLDEIAAGWDGAVALSYGGSGTLARQVAAGAPADVVLLAATDWMDWLGAQGVLDGDPVAIASNRLVLAGPPDGAALPLETGAILARLGAAGRIAMGEPMSVPAGRYAQEALTTLGLWDVLAPRMLYAEDVRAALAYVARGDVPLGIVYGSDLAGSGVGIAAEFPADAHDPIRYPGATVAGGAEGARAFLDRVGASREVFARHGFAP
ncbi:molybdate ABC transporter substrate-binding protein [uncultured Jannaschia sp.]|uniref:molybdate ABC transporter substrate-binding protein n=1 Tax=uncultured Jannaschia sp. TaxID=293347 RepID=UPI00262DD626|nr:molybdate ABC transporter substrate-binding protein [uncultured Jannaschia sp.]